MKVVRIAWEVVRTVELEPLDFESGDSLRFRIEIQRSASEPTVYRSRVWRLELFQMRPLWPDETRTSTDDVLISDDSYTGEVGTSDTADETLARVLAELERQFGPIVAGRD